VPQRRIPEFDSDGGDEIRMVVGPDDFGVLVTSGQRTWEVSNSHRRIVNSLVKMAFAEKNQLKIRACRFRAYEADSPSRSTAVTPADVSFLALIPRWPNFRGERSEPGLCPCAQASKSDLRAIPSGREDHR